ARDPAADTAASRTAGPQGVLRPSGPSAVDAAAALAAALLDRAVHAAALSVPQLPAVSCRREPGRTAARRCAADRRAVRRAQPRRGPAQRRGAVAGRTPGSPAPVLVHADAAGTEPVGDGRRTPPRGAWPELTLARVARRVDVLRAAG